MKITKRTQGGTLRASIELPVGGPLVSRPRRWQGGVFGRVGLFAVDRQPVRDDANLHGRFGQRSPEQLRAPWSVSMDTGAQI